MFPYSRTNNTLLLRLAAWLVVGGAAVTLVLVLSAVFDPKPMGAPVWSSQTGQIRVEANVRSVQWIENSFALPLTYTLRLRAARLHGELDSSYGLVVGERGNPLIVALSPLGCVTIEHGDAAVLPWQTWPHVKTGDQINEIWLDVRPLGPTSQITVRINRELLWSGEIALSGSEVGLLVESFGEPTTVDFSHLELFAP
jgi:hypothetical protein